MRRALSAALLAATCAGCSSASQGPKPDDPYLTVFVASDGTMEINGQEAAQFQLEEALQAALVNEGAGYGVAGRLSEAWPKA